MDKGIREPRQDRAIKKKEAIIKAAYEVFSDVGFYNTNTADIAKKAGVSTGIVYDYFNDKKDILFYVIKIYIDDVKAPIIKYLDSLSSPIDVDNLVDGIIDLTINVHKINANIHNVLHSLADTHNDINDEFLELESAITDIGVQKLIEFGFENKNLKEKVHLIMDMVQSYAHEYLYDNHDYINYDSMKSYVAKAIKTILED